MKILIAPDKFKTTLSSDEVSRFLKKGILQILPEAQIQDQVVSDGGEGFLEALKSLEGLTRYNVSLTDPLGREGEGYVYSHDCGSNVFIESCQATGFHLLDSHQRDPFKTSSKGLASLLKKAYSLAPENIFIGLGSSATCDGGLGLAEGLGYQFKDSQSNKLPATPTSLGKIKEIIAPEQSLNFSSTKIYGVVDVLNPPLGEDGGVVVYSPQKGATSTQVLELESGMTHYLHQLETMTHLSLAGIIGGGAAGCLGLALVAYLQAELLPGSQWLIEQLNLEKTIQSVDVLITGEGHFDEQSLSGKIPFSLMQMAEKNNKKSILVTGKKTQIPLPMCEAIFSIEELIEEGMISDIKETKQGLVLIGQMIAKKLGNGLL